MDAKTLGDVLTPVLEPVIRTIVARAGKYLSDSEAAAVQKHLAEAIKAPMELPSWWRHPLRRREAEQKIKEVGQQVQASVQSRGLYASMAQQLTKMVAIGPPAVTDTMVDLSYSWRDEVETRLRDVADQAAADATRSKAWQEVLGDLKPESWAEVVAFAFENALRADEKLRFLVQTLDYRQDQAGRVIVAMAVQNMAASLRRIALEVTSLAAVVTGAIEIGSHWH